MIKAEVNSFLGCAEGTVTADKIALVMGKNAAGKSSLLSAVSAALSSASPLNLPKNMAGMLVKTGAAMATVKLANETSETSLAYPAAEKRSTGGNVPTASNVAAAAVRFDSLSAKEKIELLRSACHADPTDAELVSALAERGVDASVAKMVARSVMTDGWDAAYERAREKGRSLKSKWSAVTGQAWGEKKAATWQPAGFAPELENASLTELEADVATAKAVCEEAIANAAVSANELARLHGIAGQRERLLAELDAAEKDVAAKRAAVSAAEANRAALSPMTKLVCPACGASLYLDAAGKLAHVGKDAGKTESSASVIAADDQKLAATAALVESCRHAAAIRVKLESSEAAAMEYEKEKAKTPADLAAAKANLADTESRLAAKKAFDEAAALRLGVLANQVIADVLDPKGIRQTKLEKALASFNAELSTLSAAAAFRETAILPDMTVTYGGRPLVLCSASERFRAETVIQCLIAEKDGSSAVVVDAADILDASSRAGLFKMLSRRDFDAFVGMTASAPDKAPDLAKLGVGRNYWVEDGSVREVRHG